MSMLLEITGLASRAAAPASTAPTGAQPGQAATLPRPVSDKALVFADLDLPHSLVVSPVPPKYNQRAEVDPERSYWAVTDVYYQPNPATKADQRRLPTAQESKEFALSKEYMSSEGYINIDTLGRPLNPIGRTGLSGKGGLWQWGPNVASDALLFDKSAGELKVLLIQRADGSWAMPGGFVNLCELSVLAAVRELGEEAVKNVSLLKDKFVNEAKMIYRGYADDPRNTDHAWIETAVHMLLVPPELSGKLKLLAADDAHDVRWVGLSELTELSIHSNHRALIDLGVQHLSNTRKN